ncbi:MAG: hypothetical protein V7739_07990 [Motiliproteus sp.]
MKAIIQQQKTGCAIAASAAIAGISYPEAKVIAAGLRISAEDATLWSSSQPIRKLLRELGYATGADKNPFNNWQALPDCALLAIKWHVHKDQPFWHWVVFVREQSLCYVVDSKKALRNNIRTDFGRIKPKWFIEVTRH